MLVSLLLKHGFGDMGKAWFTLSILEIVEEDVLRDLLKSTTLSSSSHRTRKSGGSSTSYDKMYSKKTSPINESRMKNKINNTLKIRHPDAKGAIVQNLVEVTPVSLEACEELIKTAFHSFHDNVKHVGQEESGSGGGRSGHILATLKIHHLSSSNDNTATSSTNDSNDYTLIQLVDLACADSERIIHATARGVGRSKTEVARIQDRRKASIRKSLSGLRGILRGLILNSQLQSKAALLSSTYSSPSRPRSSSLPTSSPTTTGTHSSLTYRECTLTKLVQRALDNRKSRAVVIAAVCPKRGSYRRTLETLNYVN